MFRSGLPIDAALPELLEALAAHRCAVLQAPPGAGKSTVVPLALLDEPWARGKRLIMLEPRRLAARAVAQRMARTLGQDAGGTVGYRMRLDTRISRETRIEVVTEGVLTRLLQSDPALEGVAAVIFDEFHERSLQADLGLALTLDARDNLADQLKILVMSATLDGAAVARLLGDAPIVSARGRTFPVATRYVGEGMPVLPGGNFTPGRGGTRHSDALRSIAQIVRHALSEEAGDVLVFLPGAGEIRRVQSLLEQLPLDCAAGPAPRPPGPRVNVVALFGDLELKDQERALAPAPVGERKVVLATNIAETSLTIEGIRIVVDSGLVRRALFDPATGMGRLEIQRISRASAEQRQGRAGRVAPGVCYRAWSEGAHGTLAAFSAAEIMAADLAPLALDLANWGVRDASELRWLDSPPQAMLASARDLLKRLGALGADGRISAHGRQMAHLGVHPRLAHMLLQAHKLGSAELGAQLAALLSERDLLRGARDLDMHTRLELLRRPGAQQINGADRGALQRVRRMAQELVRKLNIASSHAKESALRDEAPLGVLLAFAYPDRIGQRRIGSEQRFTLANGRGAHFSDIAALGREEFIVAVDLDDNDRDARILLAAALRRADIERYLSAQLQRSEEIRWDSRTQAVVARRLLKLDALVLDDTALPEPPATLVARAMLDGIRELGLDALPWNPEARDLQARMEFVRRLVGASAEESWPDVSDSHLGATLAEWLAPWLDGITRKAHLPRLSVAQMLGAKLSYQQRQSLESLAPTHLTVPTGSRIRIDYLDESAPALAVRLQEVFGLHQTPMIGGGKVPITFKLLSPARRPVQVTRDLASFWRGAYAEVRKDLRGRYPKHHWPENALEAQPIRGTRRKS